MGQPGQHPPLPPLTGFLPGLCRAAVSGYAGKRQPALASQQQACRQPSEKTIGMEQSLAWAEILSQDPRSAAVEPMTLKCSEQSGRGKKAATM